MYGPAGVKSVTGRSFNLTELDPGTVTMPVGGGYETSVFPFRVVPEKILAVQAGWTVWHMGTSFFLSISQIHFDINVISK